MGRPRINETAEVSLAMLAMQSKRGTPEWQRLIDQLRSATREALLQGIQQVVPDLLAWIMKATRQGRDAKALDQLARALLSLNRVSASASGEDVKHASRPVRITFAQWYGGDTGQGYREVTEVADVTPVTVQPAIGGTGEPSLPVFDPAPALQDPPTPQTRDGAPCRGDELTQPTAHVREPDLDPDLSQPEPVPVPVTPPRPWPMRSHTRSATEPEPTPLKPTKKYARHAELLAKRARRPDGTVMAKGAVTP